MPRSRKESDDLAILHALLGGSHKELDEFYRQLGWFMADYAFVELAVHQTLRHFARVTPRAAAALFSGVRAKEALNLIKRLSEAEKWNKRQSSKLQEVIEHFGPITAMRNDILHYGTEMISGDKWRVATLKPIHLESRYVEQIISTETLIDMRRDLQKIYAMLDILILGRDLASLTFLKSSRRAWRYKSPSQAAPRNTNRAKRRKRPRPSRPSRG